MCRSVYSIALVLAVVSCQGIVANDDERAKRWEKEIAAIEKRQLTANPPKGGIVFAGSSTIRLWNLDKSFPEWKPINSGFGGSEIRDSTQFAERIITKHEPRAIVMYAGDNDINSRRTPEQVAEDFRAFVAVVSSPRWPKGWPCVPSICDINRPRHGVYCPRRRTIKRCAIDSSAGSKLWVQSGLPKRQGGPD